MEMRFARLTACIVTNVQPVIFSSQISAKFWIINCKGLACRVEILGGRGVFVNKHGIPPIAHASMSHDSKIIILSCLINRNYITFGRKQAL